MHNIFLWHNLAQHKCYAGHYCAVISTAQRDNVAHNVQKYRADLDGQKGPNNENKSSWEKALKTGQKG